MGMATTAISPPERRRAHCTSHDPQVRGLWLPYRHAEGLTLSKNLHTYRIGGDLPVYTPRKALCVTALARGHLPPQFCFFFFFSHSLCPKSPLSWLSIFSKFYPGEPNPITRALKSRVLSLAGVRIDVAEEEVREIRRMRGTLPPLLEGATWKARGGLWVASRSKDGQQPGRKRTSVLPPRGTESDQKLE